jgi:hypothetical protein
MAFLLRLMNEKVGRAVSKTLAKFEPVVVSDLSARPGNNVVIIGDQA